ncbi:MAG TPA: glycosyl hydrolase [Micrococcales bacterium]|uniref:glycoside hydrolase family 3 C-terminal domain-containing protein n=1 Tax=Miniimonas arenae TaxID=676201 RepID=UPI000EE74FE7|nr:glycoside hydrolase family 3 C-terminal domain-containing protein [Miniimonas arenae]HCX84688.1 glycosyl hydrolase [Micrococcales bacterium]
MTASPSTATSSRSPFTSADVERVLAELTLEEKASLLSGVDFWRTQPVERDGETLVPSIWVSDGPHGLRKQAEQADHLGLGTSVPATCFPTAAALGSTWNVGLLEEVGAALGRETRDNGVAVLLGPGANIKRDPRCGRNFEYLSEDPVLSGDLAAALIRGIQSEGVGTSLKHFAVNNQENDRMRVSAEVDERTLREVYLASFERAVAGGDPWTLMCSYNKVNGVYASNHRSLLTDVLRKQWGWDGLVMSDWGAVRDRVAGVAAGLDLEMPSSNGRTDAEVVAAVRDGRLAEADVDTAVRRLLTLVAKADDGVARLGGAADPSASFDAHHALARRAAAAGSVLLRNEPVPAAGEDGADNAPLLPLSSAEGLVVVGEFARTPRYQGAGSSQVNPHRLDTALDALAEAFGAPVPFAPGFAIAEGPATESSEEELVAEAVELARGARTVLVYLGLPAAAESEGFDRTDIDLPADQLRLLAALAEVNPRLAVVLSNGSVVSVSQWQHLAPAVLEAWLGGQAGAAGVVDVLTGRVSPSGRLGETIPLRLQDVPSFGHFPGALGTVHYGEGLYVGYRGYDLRDAPVAYPFGFGLSYTTFAIEDVAASVSGSGADVRVAVTARVTNTGSTAGTEVVQVYVGDPASLVDRPERELKAFASVELAPGESREVSFDLDSRALAYWNPVLGRWTVEGGEFLVSVGSSSRDLAATVSVQVEGEDVSAPLTPLSTVGELRANPVGAAVVEPFLARLDDGFLAMIDDIPLTVVESFGMLPLEGGLSGLLERANAARR